MGQRDDTGPPINESPSIILTTLCPLVYAENESEMKKAKVQK